jgi:cytochrome bd-type quinol oxidase subunit 2
MPSIALSDHAGYGSALATFAQGVVLGAFIQGFSGRRISTAAV